MRTPVLNHRDRILAFCQEEQERLGRPVLILPTARLMDAVPSTMPDGFAVKDRAGRPIAKKLAALSVKHAFDAAVLHGIAFTNHIRGVGDHMTEYSGGYETDLMAANPDQLNGRGNLLIIDGKGWAAIDHDPLLTDGGRFDLAIGNGVLLGHGIVDLSDIHQDIRQVKDPGMEHYQTPQPIA